MGKDRSSGRIVLALLGYCELGCALMLLSPSLSAAECWGSMGGEIRVGSQGGAFSIISYGGPSPTCMFGGADGTVVQFSAGPETLSAVKKPDGHYHAVQWPFVITPNTTGQTRFGSGGGGGGSVRVVQSATPAPMVLPPPGLYDGETKLPEDLEIRIPLCGVDVPHLLQGDFYRDEPIGSTSKTIGQIGCAITSLAMVYNYADPLSHLNPLDIARLNVFSPEGDVDWNRAVQEIRKFTDPNGLNPYSQLRWAPAPAQQYSDTFNFCKTPDPQIAGVKRTCKTVWIENDVPVQQCSYGHFVVVTGKELTQKGVRHTINDPAGIRKWLEDYEGGYELRGTASFAPRFGQPMPMPLSPSLQTDGSAYDFSALTVHVGDEAELLMTGPGAERTGFDPLTRTIVNQIPQSAYARDAYLDDTVDEVGAGPWSRHIGVNQPTSGSYQIVLTGASGTTPADARLIIFGISVEGNITAQHSVEVRVQPGETTELSFSVDSNTPTAPQLVGGQPPISTHVLGSAPVAADWFRDPVNVTIQATTSDPAQTIKSITYEINGSSVVVPGDIATFTVVAEGHTTIRYFAQGARGEIEEHHEFVIKIDRTGPDVACVSPGSAWSPVDVTIACEATDSQSGLNGSSSIALITAIPEGVETLAAATNSAAMCDLVGNCTTAGPISGLRIDKAAPQIIVPANLRVDQSTLGGAHVDYATSADDRGSGLASLVCSPPSGSLFGPGVNTVSCNAIDTVGNSATATFEIDVRGVPEQLMALIDSLHRMPIPDPARSQIVALIANALTEPRRVGVLCELLDRLSRHLATAERIPPGTVLQLRTDIARIRGALGCS